jgi:hypothetical protein
MNIVVKWQKPYLGIVAYSLFRLLFFSYKRLVKSDTKKKYMWATIERH